MDRAWGRIIAGVGISLGIHAVLAAGLAVYLAAEGEPENFPQLDLTSVELSFSEHDAELAPVAPIPLASPSGEMKPSVEEPPPSPNVKSCPPDLSAEPDFPKVADKTDSMPLPSVAPQQARLDAPPRPLCRIRPKYPRAARERGEEGEVTLELVVAEDGSVRRVGVIRSSGFAELDEAAVQAVRAARFRPAEASGRPVEATATLSLRFKLN